MTDVDKCLEQIVRVVDLLTTAIEEVSGGGRLSEDLRRMLRDAYDALITYCAR